MSFQTRSKTAHSLAHNGIRGTPQASLLDKLGGERIPIFHTQAQLQVRAARFIGYDGRARTLSAYQIARHAVRTIDEFCKSSDETIGPEHVPRMPGLARAGYRQLVDIVLPYAHAGWADIIDPRGTAVKFGHGHYLKLWALQHPRIGRDGDALFLDEAQDTSPVLAGVLSEQAHLQRVVVGDSAQAIYRFTGATSYMTDAALPGSVERRLTQSWRFGQRVADEANQLLVRLGDDMRLTGNPALDSRVDHTLTDPDAILTRTNGCAVEHVMREQLQGRKVHLFGDKAFALAFCDGAQRLQNGHSANTVELLAFSSWGQVVEYAEESPDGADWRVLIKLIAKHGLAAVRHALERTVPVEQADLIVATAHKAKGREWDRVLLDDDLAEAVDFAAGRRDPAALRDELMLGYVAVTRARAVLNPGRLTQKQESDGPLTEHVSTPVKHVAARRFLDALDRMEGLATLDEIIESVIEKEGIHDSAAARDRLADEIDKYDNDFRWTWKWFDHQWVSAGGRKPVEEAQRRAQLDMLASLTETLPPEVSTRQLSATITGTALSHVSTRRLAELWEDLTSEPETQEAQADPAPSPDSSEVASAAPNRGLGKPSDTDVESYVDRSRHDEQALHSAAYAPHTGEDMRRHQDRGGSNEQGSDSLSISFDPELERVDQREHDPADVTIPDVEVDVETQGHQGVGRRVWARVTIARRKFGGIIRDRSRRL